MTNQEIFDRLKAIAKMDCEGVEFLGTFSVMGESLARVQNAVADLLLDIAHSFPTEKQELSLVEEMPWAFNDLMELPDGQSDQDVQADQGSNGLES